ncbi:SigE family RNA polymerase sigma factor [Actinospica robiniae]|uniref:SigE family RNA polymerase sigma factor n=1 Tax=Actinospica robiniae TaxID=304901 RepID=UPI0005575547|nr:SigE family RNA polymerase sigma factor [Actinospica robiniae]
MRDSVLFDEFYTASVRRISGYVYAMTGDAAETEDVVQEAYGRAWQHWEQVSGYANPEAWLRTVAYRIRISRWRRAAAGFKAHRRHGAAQDLPELSVDYVALIAALRAIPANQCRAIVLYYLVGLSIEEIAQETGVAAGTVKSQLSRARTRLAVLLTDSDGRPGQPQFFAKEASSRA